MKGYFQHKKLLARQAIQLAWETLGGWSILFTFIPVLVTNLITAEKPLKMQSVLGGNWNISVIVYLITIAFTFGIFFLAADFKDYVEKEKKLQRYERENLKKVVNSTRFLDMCPQITFPKINDDNHYAYLEISNRSTKHDICNCFARLEKIFICGIVDNDTFFDYERIHLVKDKRLAWMGYDDNKITIRKGRAEKIPVASFIKGRPLYILTVQKFSVPNANFFIEISINGIVDGLPICERVFTGTITIESKILESPVVTYTSTNENGKEVQNIPSHNFRDYEFVFKPKKKEEVDFYE